MVSACLAEQLSDTVSLGREGVLSAGAPRYCSQCHPSLDSFPGSGWVWWGLVFRERLMVSRLYIKAAPRGSHPRSSLSLSKVQRAWMGVTWSDLAQGAFPCAGTH